MTDGGRDQTSTGGSKGTLRILGSVNVQQPSRVAAFGDGTGQETLEIAAPISGSADLTVAGTSAFGDHRGTVRLSAANPYTGNISVFRPTPVASTIASETNRLLQINHLDALKFASLGLYSTQENPLSFTPASNTNSYNVGNFEGISAQVLADTTGAPVTLSIGANGADAYYDGALSGGGSIIKVGGGTQTFTAVNAYAGNTTITAGTLVLEQPGLSDTGTVSIVGGASLDLLGGNDIVGGLVLNGVMKGPGIYGAGNSGGLITGDGTLEVVGAPAGSFITFMDTFPGLSAGDKLPSADPDRDGITNLVEYALSGFDPTLPNSLAGSLSGGTLSFSKRDEAVTNNDISYIIETSINLGNAPGDWTNASPVVNDSTTASYVLPTGLGKVFARLRIVKN